MAARIRPGFHATLLASCALIFLLTLTQRRNVYYGALMGGMAALELAAGISARLRRRLPFNERRYARAPLFSVVLGALVLPMLISLPRAIQSDYEAGPDRMGALLKLRELMPSEIDMFDPRMLDPAARIPELARADSVLAFWSQGHLVTYYSERPVVANNFGYAFFDSLRFFFAESENEALAIARAHRARFVLSVDILQSANDYGAAIGKGNYVEMTGHGGVITPAWFRTLQARMHDFDGQGATLPGGIRVEPLAHFTLRYASAAGSRRFGRFVPLIKVFELVE